MNLVIIGAVHLLLLISVAIIIGYWERESRAFKWLAALLLFSFVCDAATILNWLLRLNIEPNLPSNLNTALNPFFIGLFFYYLLRGTWLKYGLIAFVAANFIFSITLSLRTQALGSLNTLTESFLILTLCLMWYFRILKVPPANKIQEYPDFWVVTGFFLPTSGKVIVYTVSTYLINVLNDNLTVLSMIHNLLSVLGNALILYGLVIQRSSFRRDMDPRLAS